MASTKSNTMQKCVDCGYEYDEAKGNFHHARKCPHPSTIKDEDNIE